MWGLNTPRGFESRPLRQDARFYGAFDLFGNLPHIRPYLAAHLPFRRRLMIPKEAPGIEESLKQTQEWAQRLRAGYGAAIPLDVVPRLAMNLRHR